MRFQMMIGLDGSGRSECAEALGLTVVQDEKTALKLLGEGRSVTLDAPNLSARQRKALLERLNRLGCETRAILYAARLDDCMQREPLHQKEIRRQYLSFCPPQAYEGWDEIVLRYAPGTVLTPLDELFFGKEGLVFLPQDNPFHKHSVGLHCLRAARLTARERPDDPTLWLASLLHDIGKAKTKAFLDSHGNPSETAHYYGHELASAYECLFVAFPSAVPESERLRVSALVAWHMMPHHFTNEKTRARYRRLWGEEFLRDMLVIERSDRGAQN